MKSKWIDSEIAHVHVCIVHLQTRCRVCDGIDSRGPLVAKDSFRQADIHWDADAIFVSEFKSKFGLSELTVRVACRAPHTSSTAMHTLERLFSPSDMNAHGALIQ